MIPSYFRLDILAMRTEFCTLGDRGVKFSKIINLYFDDVLPLQLMMPIAIF